MTLIQLIRGNADKDVILAELVKEQNNPIKSQRRWEYISHVIGFNKRQCLCNYYMEYEDTDYTCNETCPDGDGDCELHYKCLCLYPNDTMITEEEQKYIIKLLHEQGYVVTGCDIGTALDNFVVELFGVTDDDLARFKRDKARVWIQSWNALRALSGIHTAMYAN
jgi:hypothetical protein